LEVGFPAFTFDARDCWRGFYLDDRLVGFDPGEPFLLGGIDRARIARELRANCA
jgi:hypothetical protein